MSAVHFPPFERQSDTGKPVTESLVVTGQSTQCASFLLEVRNRAQVTSELIANLNAILSASGFDITLTPTEVLGVQADLADAAAPVRAEARGEARLVKWIQDGTLVEGSKVEAAWGVKRQTVDAARERGEIFSVWVKSKHWYPGEALKLERSALAAVNRALGDVDPSSKLLFLLKQHGALGGHCAADAIAHGHLDDVVRLASGWARS